MFIPELRFERSWLYDRALARKIGYMTEPKGKLARRLRDITRLWEIHGRAILREISRVTGLPWRERDINVYLTWGIRAYSTPLTITDYGTPTDTLDTLTHELIHRIISDPVNFQRIRPRWKALMKRYWKESFVTRVHVYVHAVHKIVLQRLFSKARLKRQTDFVRLRDYRRAWELVERDGAEAIVVSIHKPRT